MSKFFVTSNKIPAKSKSFLTPGKRYELTEPLDYRDDGGSLYGNIVCDSGEKLCIKVKYSKHLDGESWELIEE